MPTHEQVFVFGQDFETVVVVGETHELAHPDPTLLPGEVRFVSQARLELHAAKVGALAVDEVVHRGGSRLNCLKGEAAFDREVAVFKEEVDLLLADAGEAGHGLGHSGTAVQARRVVVDGQFPLELGRNLTHSGLLWLSQPGRCRVGRVGAGDADIAARADRLRL